MVLSENGGMVLAKEFVDIEKQNNAIAKTLNLLFIVSVFTG